jgi:hypothetical protein
MIAAVVVVAIGAVAVVETTSVLVEVLVITILRELLALP